MFQTTEITSNSIASDNPVHQRLYFAYHEVQSMVSGQLLEVGCGVGRGLELLIKQSAHYTAIDKNGDLLEKLGKEYPSITFLHRNIPPFSGIADHSFDVVVSFQVIEHIRNDKLFLKEIHRVLKPGGKAIITTPNRAMSLTRNPWHEREYLLDELKGLCTSIYSNVKTLGVYGNEKVMRYFDENRVSVERITRWDIFNLQYLLPAPILRIPYDFLNRRNRKKLMDGDNSLVSSIRYDDYFIKEADSTCLDFYFILEK
ncbi:MAG: class I SAM-dependent methyltransferase [Cytophagales bacterium]|nr:class I SAM-dependent methyltransferase [Cytophagales bacterium]